MMWLKSLALNNDKRANRVIDVEKEEIRDE